MPRTRSHDIYTPKTAMHVEVDGVPTLLRPSIDRIRAGHPLLDGREDMFELIEVQYDIEQATAAPGEKRGGPDKT